MTILTAATVAIAATAAPKTYELASPGGQLKVTV